MGSSVVRLSPTYLFWELKLHTGVWRGTGGRGPPFTTSPTDTVSFRPINTDFLALNSPSGSKNADRFSSTQLPRAQGAGTSQQGKKTATPPHIHLLDPLIKARLDRYETRKLPVSGNHNPGHYQPCMEWHKHDTAPLSMLVAHSFKASASP